MRFFVLKSKPSLNVAQPQLLYGFKSLKKYDSIPKCVNMKPPSSTLGLPVSVHCVPFPILQFWFKSLGLSPTSSFLNHSLFEPLLKFLFITPFGLPKERCLLRHLPPHKKVRRDKSKVSSCLFPINLHLPQKKTSYTVYFLETKTNRTNQMFFSPILLRKASFKTQKTKHRRLGVDRSTRSLGFLEAVKASL